MRAQPRKHCAATRHSSDAPARSTRDRTLCCISGRRAPWNDRRNAVASSSVLTTTLLCSMSGGSNLNSAMPTQLCAAMCGSRLSAGSAFRESCVVNRRFGRWRDRLHGHIFRGIGGGARGFNRGEARVAT